MKTFTAVPCVFLLLGLVLIGGSGWLALRNQRFIATAATAEGQVVDLLEHISRDQSKRTRTVTYRPVVEFTVGGELIRYESSSGANPPSYEVGERVTVYYDPANPRAAMLDDFAERWLGPLVMAILGTVISVVCGIVLAGELRMFRRRRA